MTKFKTGDLVRCTVEAATEPRRFGRVGDVFRVEPVPCPDERYQAVRIGINGGSCDPGRFELIARAGEPVTFQPGDVIERISDAIDGVREIGDRCTVVRMQSDDVVRHIKPNGQETRAPVEHFKLVHRPAKSEKLDRPISVDEIKPGDFVTVRAQVCEVTLSEVSLSTRFIHGSQIIGHEPAPEKPLAVGDRVEHVNGMTPRRSEYRIALIENEQLVLRGESGSLCIVRRKDWRRVR